MASQQSPKRLLIIASGVGAILLAAGWYALNAGEQTPGSIAPEVRATRVKQAASVESVEEAPQEAAEAIGEEQNVRLGSVTPELEGADVDAAAAPTPEQRKTVKKPQRKRAKTETQQEEEPAEEAAKKLPPASRF